MKPTIKRRGIKPAFALSVLAAALFGAASASASYVEQGLLGDANSWKSAEFMKSWGPRGMKAEKAYALGFYGQGANVGVMDSGTLASHVEFDPTRFTYVVQKGTYGSDGERFRGSLPSFPPLKGTNPKGAYKKGEAFDVTGAFDININDSHGTKVAGVIGASRDGSGMHGIAWGAHVTNANTGGSDENNYGPFQDYNFFLNGWGALVEAGAQVINNSWGTNVRIVGKSTDKFGPDYGKVGDMLPTNTVADVEYEYFYFKKMYGDNYNFVDAAWHAVKDTPNKVVQIMTTGNRDMKNPFHRALYPYFHPEAENQWIAVAGIQPDKDLFVIDAKGKNTERHEGVEGHLILQDNYNEAGFAKWWTVVGPTLSGSGVSADMVMETSAVKQDPTKDTNDPNYKRFYPEFDDEYGTFSGTSCAAPHVAGAMGVLLSRYANMNSSQVRDVMFTTATHKNTDGTDFEWWTAEEGTPDERYGWGLPDLEKGMYGPGQFLGAMEYNASVAPLDVWTNDISQVALEARKVEDQDWLDEWNKNGIDSDSLFADGYSLGDTFVVNDNDKDDTNHIVDIEDAKKWRKEYADKRAASIKHKLDNDLYEGSLIKRGEGTLIMTGNNTYTGGTTVEAGKLYGFAESFGSGTVVVNGGEFGLMSSYIDTFTQKGTLTSKAGKDDLVSAEIKEGGTFAIVAGSDLKMRALDFAEGSKVTVAVVDEALAKRIIKTGESVETKINIRSLTGFADAEFVNSDFAFLDTSLVEVSDEPLARAAAGPNLVAAVSKSSTTAASLGDNKNARAVGAAVDASLSGDLFNALSIASKAQVSNTLESLGNDFYLSADSASVVNALKMSRSVKDAAQQAVSVNDHSRLWASVNGSIGSADFGQADFDVDSQGIMIGAEIDTSERHTAGVFFGTGKTKFKGGKFGKIDSDDLTVGVYGQYNAEVLAVDYGVMHTKQDREGNRLLLVGNEAGVTQISPTTQITQAFAELAYTGFSNDKYSVEPYAGLNIMKVKSDGYNEAVGQMLFTTEENKQTLEIATVGVRGSLPFAAGGVQMAVKGDLSAAHFFGDTTPEAVMHLADTGVAKIEGGKLKNIFGVGLGVEAQLCPVAKVELSYNGAYNSDVKSSGVNLNLRMSF